MVVSDIEAVCRSEAQRVLFYLRGNRKHGSLSRGWRQLDPGSPVRQLCEWRSGSEAAAAALLEPLLEIVRSPDFAGPATYVALEAARAVILALCEEAAGSGVTAAGTSGEGAGEAKEALARQLVQVSRAVCGCVFEETHPQMDEATTMQMISVLGICTSSPAGKDSAIFTVDDRMGALGKVLALWGHYKNSPALRSCAQEAMQRMLDFACSNLDAQADFVRRFLERMTSEIGPSLPAERALLYLRCIERFALHPAARRWAMTDSSQAHFFHTDTPLLLMSIGEHFSTSISVLSMLLPVLNRICWLCVDFWGQSAAKAPSRPSPGPGGGAGAAAAASFGALQMEALIGAVYLRSMRRAAEPLQAPEASKPGLSIQEGTELLVVLLEALSDLLQVDTVRAIWLSFDADWRRPPLLQQMIQCIVDLFRDLSHTGERPLPASVVHLSTTVLGRIVSAFLAPAASGAAASTGATSPEGPGRSEALQRLKEQWSQREATLQLMAKIEESPKKARAALESTGLLDFVHLPAGMAAAGPGGASGAEGEHEEWALKLAWVFRCLNHYIPYAAVGEFFGQPKPDSEKVFAAFVETFDCGNSDLDEALRCFLQAFLLPKEAQQIDRVLKMFAHTYYRKHLEHCSAQGRGAHYLKHQDAAYTLAFSVILLNSDQHNPKVKRRMTVKNFVSNNRGINEGEDIPEDVQVRIFESVRENEIKTPSSGSLCDGISAARWNDFMQLVRIGYRDNALTVAMEDRAAHLLGFLECSGERVRLALESALAADAGAHSDALQGLEQLLHLTLDCPEADSVAEGLFFFGAEAFHEAQQRASLGRASACLQVLFRTASWWLTRMSTKQLHMLVYLTVQFAHYGLIERALPPVDAATARLLRAPSLVVDPPTGVVYSFLRKISTAPFKMLSFTEEGEDGGAAKAPPPAPSVPRSAPASVRGPSPGSPGSPAGSAGGGGGGGPRSMPSASPREPIIKEDEAGAPLLAGTERPPEAAAAAAGVPAVVLQPPQGGGAAAAAAVEGASPRGDRAPEEAAMTPRAVLTSPRLLVPGSATDEASLHNDPLRPQIEKVFEMSELEGFIRGLVAVWNPTPPSAAAEGAAPSAEPGAAAAAVGAGTAEASRAFLGYLGSVFLALRKSDGGKVTKDQDLPWWPEPPAWPGLTAPQGLLLPKRALALNILDGYEALRLAVRLALATLGNAPGNEQLAPLWDRSTVQEFSACAHVGILYTLRRPDLGERTLRMGIVGVFQMASILLLLRLPDGYPISAGWPVRLVEALVRRADGEPTLLVPMTKVCLEAVRTFITEVSRCRALEQLELWRLLLQLLLKAAPTKARALWPGAKDREVEGVQYQLWRQGILWVLGHPGLLDCLSLDSGAAGASTSTGAPSASATFWAQALAELTALAQEIAAGNRAVSARLLLDAYRVLLSNISKVQSPEEYEQEEAAREQAGAEEDGSSSRPLPMGLQHPEEPGGPSAAPGASPPLGGSPCRPQARELGAAADARRLAARSESWARVAIALLTYIGPAVGRAPPPEGSENEPLALLKQTMLNVGVPPLLGATAQGPYWARLVLEKVVSMLTGPATSGAPLLVVRDAVSLVAKFFLQNLQTLQRHECFGQLWLMVLRLMLLFIKRGTDDKDVELEEIATETLRNLLWVLLSTNILGFVTPKATAAAGGGVPEEHSGPQVWWQMTWDCIEVFLPGFGDEFSRSFPPADAAEAPQAAADDRPVTLAATEQGAAHPNPSEQLPSASNRAAEAPVELSLVQGAADMPGPTQVVAATAEETLVEGAAGMPAPTQVVAATTEETLVEGAAGMPAPAQFVAATADETLVEGVAGMLAPTQVVAATPEETLVEGAAGMPAPTQVVTVIQETSPVAEVPPPTQAFQAEQAQLGGLSGLFAEEPAAAADLVGLLPAPQAAQAEPVPVEGLAAVVAEAAEPGPLPPAAAAAAAP